MSIEKDKKKIYGVKLMLSLLWGLYFGFNFPKSIALAKVFLEKLTAADTLTSQTVHPIYYLTVLLPFVDELILFAFLVVFPFIYFRGKTNGQKI